MAALGDEIRARGLKFGIYSDAGFFTCQRFPGSLGHEAADAAQFARWGVDYLKCARIPRIPSRIPAAPPGPHSLSPTGALSM